MAEWRGVFTFAELVARGVLEIGDGYRAKLEELGGSGPIFFRAALLDSRGMNWAQAERFHAELISKVRSKAGRTGDTVVTTKGNSVGRTGYVPSGVPPFVYSPHLSYWRSLDLSQLSPRFMYYWSLSREFNLQLRSMAYSTDMAPYLSLTDQRRLRISLPEIAVQQAVADVLGGLDDKIAVNAQIIPSCDELRTLKTKYWMQSNPEMAQEIPLSSIGKFVNGRAFTKNASGTGRMVIRIAEINSGPGGSTVYNDIEVPEQHLARPGDVLFAWSGSLAVARWFRPEAIINQHIFKVIPRDGLPVWLAFELVQAKLRDFKAIAAGKATTMGHIQRHHLDESVLAPTQSCVLKLDAELGPLWERALAAERESLTLAELRDALLPGLMSGEIRIRDAEKIVEDAT
ncbi:MAG TPA: restriction endonuclease subunit S [Streptosporangiaceae bacterium]|nr:restriction endonuclease subunit S [Streptosporangiaceae bacterium]